MTSPTTPHPSTQSCSIHPAMQSHNPPNTILCFLGAPLGLHSWRLPPQFSISTTILHSRRVRCPHPKALISFRAPRDCDMAKNTLQLSVGEHGNTCQIYSLPSGKQLCNTAAFSSNTITGYCRHDESFVDENAPSPQNICFQYPQSSIMSFREENSGRWCTIWHGYKYCRCYDTHTTCFTNRKWFPEFFNIFSLPHLCPKKLQLWKYSCILKY